MLRNITARSRVSGDERRKRKRGNNTNGTHDYVFCNNVGVFTYRLNEENLTEKINNVLKTKRKKETQPSRLAMFTFELLLR